MESLEEDLYSAAFRKWEISPSSKVHGYGPDGTFRTFENDFGEGEYWSYFRGNLFAINSFIMRFTKNWVLKYRCTEHLCIGFYDEIEGVTQRQGAPLSVGSISVYLGGERARNTKHAFWKEHRQRAPRSPFPLTTTERIFKTDLEVSGI